MSFKIGFSIDNDREVPSTFTTPPDTIVPRKCLAEVYFPSRGTSYTYYNDSFNLKVGDLVYVEGKLEGYKGRVINLNYTFKIKLSDYKRVISVVDTDIKGQFYFASSHLISNERTALPFEKIKTWFFSPETEDEEYISSDDGTEFSLDDLSQFKVSELVAERGYDYYNDCRVAYLEIDGHKGRAIVNGTQSYTVEFEYYDGTIRNILCDCYCCFNCKHEFAAMLQLKETLNIIKEHYPHIDTNDYLCAVSKKEFFETVAAPKQLGKFNIG